MHLGVLQRRGHAVGTDEMFFRNEQTGPRARFPLQRLFQLLRGAIELDCDRRLRSGFWRNCRRRNKTVAELESRSTKWKGRK